MTAAPKAPAIRSSCDGKVAKRRPAVYSGKANVPGEETGDSTLGAAGVGVPARREGRQRQRWEGPLRSRGWQQPAKTFRIRAKPEIGRRVKAWRMSPYEQRREGNAFREGARRLPHEGNAGLGQGALGAWQSQGRSTGQPGGTTIRTSLQGKPPTVGCM